MSVCAWTCLTICDPMDLACQASLSMGFSWQEYWSGWPCSSPRDIPDPRSNPHLLCLLYCRWILYHWVTGEAQSNGICFQKLPNKEILFPVYYVGEFLETLRNIVNHAQIFLENRLRGYLIMHYIHWVFNNQFKQSYYKK